LSDLSAPPFHGTSAPDRSAPARREPEADAGAVPLRVGPALGWVRGLLAASGVPDAGRESRLLIRLATGRPAADLDPQASLSAEQAAALWRAAGRRSRREPLAYIRGWAEFYSLPLEVGPAVLIPRPETELLVEEGLRFLAIRPGRRLEVVDLGAGSGAISVAVAAGEPRARVWGVEASPAAAAVALRNVERHGFAERVTCRTGRWWKALPARMAGRIDAALCNPPYVGRDEWPALQPEVRDWEPRAALVAEAGPLTEFAAVTAAAAAWLAPGGLLAFEVGIGQARAVGSLLADAGFTVRLRRDHAGVERVVLGLRA
jgi:release factor glutamine methyltransferase